MDSLQFQCPACDKRLRVPASAAGQRGPCPSCGEEIIGPQPALGIPARLSLHPGPPLHEIPLPPEPRPAPLEPATTDRSSVSKALEVFQPKEVSTEPDPPEPTPADPPPEPESTTEAPAPQTEPAPEEDPLRRIRRLWAAVFVLSCILCTVLAFIGGYLTALKRFESAAPIFAPVPNDSEALTLPPEFPPLPPLPADPSNSTRMNDGEVPSTDEKEGSASTLDSRTTLEAFLSAPDWAARSAYVAAKEHPGMKTAAEAEGDGPIQVTSIEPSLLDGDLHHYRVTTLLLPQGFPVTLRSTADGWQVDWPSFHEFSTNRFARFIAGKLGDEGRFRVFLKPSEDSQPAFAAYLLASPSGGTTATAYASRSSETFASLTVLLDSDTLTSHPHYQELLNRTGLPMTVELARKTSSEGQPYLEFTRVVATSWEQG